MRLFRKKIPPPPFWETYLEHISRSCSPQTSLEKVRFVVFDTETTGLNAKRDKILSIGALTVQQQTIHLQDSLECYLQQEAVAQQETIAVHGILPGKSLSGIPEKQALENFVHFLGNSIIVGHNIGFDIAIINQGLKRHWNLKLKNRSLDTRKLAIRLEHFAPPLHLNMKLYSLDALCKRYHIPLSDRHTAPGDALITAILFLKLASRLKKRGVKTLGQLM